MPNRKDRKNFAYIDGANLHNGISSQGWTLDYRRFRIWLKDKFGVTHAYIFIGLIPKYAKLYKRLQECGFILVFKEVVFDAQGKPKGNCDADLVLQATMDHFQEKCEQVVIVTSDGDYASLITMLHGRGSLLAVLSPSQERKCSILIKKTNVPVTYLTHVRSHLQASHNEKAPGQDGT